MKALSEIARDKEGYLLNTQDWRPELAQALATEEGLELSDQHWEIIELLRGFYQEFEESPAMRILVKQAAIKLGKDKGNSIYFMRLFPPSPAKLASKIAGLPKPLNCL
ncbi:MAG: TusE/DsrC/DsvC family sulfur relay protein [Cellvibrionaceae bacterium]|nr:TusE/DsrC/DsvC family sulfur relay protein [Cellvibrionaceae bacterium]MCV6625094.1 TusE/DsrC/DsvC family sulfur relay protein [Cellvibrionaceae bacterium]